MESINHPGIIRRAVLEGAVVAGSLLIVLALVAVYVHTPAEYLFFHTLAELFSIIVALALFLLALSIRNQLENGFLLLIGISALAVGALDLVHTLMYQGSLLRVADAAAQTNMTTQLWVAARLVQATALLAAPAFLYRRLPIWPALAAYLAVTAGLLLAIVQWRVFPDCYLAPGGLTPFKIDCEYVICAILAAAGVLLWRGLDKLCVHVIAMMLGAIWLMVVGELCFTLYRSPQGLFNAAGHLFKIATYYLMYRALVHTGLVRPLDLLFRDLQHSRQELSAARDELELRVRQRTAELACSVEALRLEIAERRTLEHEILRVDELERQRIGGDLHDTLGQTLAGVSFLTQALRQRLARGSPDDAAAAAEIQQLINEAVGLTRTLACGLCPVEVQADGLMTALDELAARLRAVYGVECAFACVRPVLVHDARVATHLYQIAREATTNAVRHSRAKKLWIMLEQPDGHVDLTIGDDGCGLPADLPSDKGLGLRLMRHRASLIGAELALEAAPGGGTRVRCRLATE